AWLNRGGAHAQLGHWEAAAADFARAVEFTTEPEARYLLADVRVFLGDWDDHHRVGADLLRQTETTANAALALEAVWFHGRFPVLAADPDRLVQLLDRAADKEPPSYLLARARGAALLRAGRPAEAVRELKQGLALRKEEAPATWLLLAMAHQALGQGKEARRLLDQATGSIHRMAGQQPDATVPGGSLNLHGRRWRERVLLRLLHLEAELRIKGAAAASREVLTAHQVQAFERVLALERKVPAILRGEARPADAAERVAFA